MIKPHDLLVYCLYLILLTSVFSQTAEENSRADFFAKQQKEALKLIQDGKTLTQTRDRYSPTANSGNGGYVSQARHRQAGQEMIAKGNRLLKETIAGLNEFENRKQEVAKFLQNMAVFQTWEAVDGRQVEAAVFSRDIDSVTLVRRDGLVFTMEKQELAAKHEEFFVQNRLGLPSYQASDSGTYTPRLNEAPALAEKEIKTTETLAVDLPSIHECVEQLVSDLSGALDRNKITALGVTRFYINGSSLDNQSDAYLNRVLAVLLNHGEFDVFDRSTLSVVLDEDKLQYLVSGETDTSLPAGEAIVVGDLIFAKNCSEALVVIRAVETSSSKLLFARTARARISSDEMKGFNLAYRDITSETLPAVEPESEQKMIRSLEGAKSKATGFSVVFDTPQTEDLPLWGRIGYFETLELAANTGMILYDRDLLLSLFEEAGLNSNDDQALSFGDALISISIDGVAAGQTKASVKIYNRSNSALLGISELRFTGDSDGQVAKPWNDSFAATLQHIKKLTSLSADELKFEVAFNLENLRQDPEIVKLFSEDSSDSSSLACLSFTRPGDGYALRRDYARPSRELMNQVDLITALDQLSQRLVIYYEKQSDFEVIVRCKTIYPIVFGLIGDDGKLLLGLTHQVSRLIRHRVTTSREGEALHNMWIRIFDSRFIDFFIESDDSLEGTFTHEDISFNYFIDYRFKGIYPEWVTLQIDLTPMKDRLYKVIKNENENN